MTDRQVLQNYRLHQATQTLEEARRMLSTGFSARSTINRAYYAMFYAVLGLFISRDIEPKFSKHSGVIGTFDREFILSGKLEARHSRALHRLFEARQKADYKELVEMSHDDAAWAVACADEFVMALREVIDEEERA